MYNALLFCLFPCIVNASRKGGPKQGKVIVYTITFFNIFLYFDTHYYIKNNNNGYYIIMINTQKLAFL